LTLAVLSLAHKQGGVAADLQEFVGLPLKLTAEGDEFGFDAQRPLFVVVCLWGGRWRANLHLMIDPFCGSSPWLFLAVIVVV
jgi:hypothetical protein